MMTESWNGITGPLGNDSHHRVGQHRPVLTILGGHLLNTHARGKDMIGAVLISHDRIMNHRRISCEHSPLVMKLSPKGCAHSEHNRYE